jgi:acyl-coenzyme A synthetase/AMP-(fatty) acid ligase
MKSATKLLETKWTELFALDFLGRESPELFGETTKDIKKPILLHFRVNILQETALRDEVGYYRITGRMDDVIIVSGHNLGTAPIEDSINLHPAVAESAIVGFLTILKEMHSMVL